MRKNSVFRTAIKYEILEKIVCLYYSSWRNNDGCFY